MSGRNAEARWSGLLGPALALVMASALSGCVSVTRVGEASPSPGASQARTGAASPGATPSSLARSTPAAPPTGSDATPATGSPAASALRSGRTRIGYLALDDSNAFLRSVDEGIRSAAETADVELIECSSGWTRQGVLACAESLGRASVDGLVSFQPYAELGAEVCAATGEVPTVGIVFEQGPCQVSRLRIDQFGSGRLAGAAVGAFAAERWDCQISAYVSLESSDADPDGRARMTGYRSGYEEYCPLPERMLVLDGADRVATAQTQVARLLDGLRGRHIVIVGLNEDAILGAMAAVEAAGRDGQVWYSGQLADPAIREHIACDGQYIASVAQFPEQFGEALVPLLAEALDGSVVPALVDAPLALVTVDNVRELFPNTPACSR